VLFQAARSGFPICSLPLALLREDALLRPGRSATSSGRRRRRLAAQRNTSRLYRLCSRAFDGKRVAQPEALTAGHGFRSCVPAMSPRHPTRSPSTARYTDCVATGRGRRGATVLKESEDYNHYAALHPGTARLAACCGSFKAVVPPIGASRSRRRDIEPSEPRAVALEEFNRVRPRL